MNRAWVGRAALGFLALLVACAGSPEETVRSSFSARYSCDSAYVKVGRDGGAYAATGCQHAAAYECDAASSCRFVTEGPPPKLIDGVPLRPLRLEVALGANLQSLLLTASPQVAENAELALDGTSATNCALALMIDGQRLDLPAGVAKTSLTLPREVMDDLGLAHQVGLQACGQRWSLDAAQLQQIRGFVRQYEEDLAWQSTPRKGGTGGRRPPLGGWSAWQTLSDFPSAAPVNATMSGTELFEKLSPSVLRVETTRAAGGGAQGSAVAVTKSLLLTNCHIVEGATKVIVKRAGHEWPAKLHASDPAKDRCVLEVAEAPFTPVGGVRAYVDLKVGEPLYTLGNPNGLDLTLGNGILSALREDAGVRYVQTSAPISPGSSGGGLFDARGNLVGITTLVMVGKEHLNQSLNFAVAAEMFWSP